MSPRSSRLMRWGWSSSPRSCSATSRSPRTWSRTHSSACTENGRPCKTRTRPLATSGLASSTAAALLLAPDADGMVSAEESALVGEANREVLAALRALPARQREAVVLRHYLGLTEEEAAQAMKITRGTVKSATSRGL